MNDTALEIATQVVETEIYALQGMMSRLDQSFVKAIDIVMGCQGRVAIVGMGKSGIIGHKISATLASTGTPSYFVHPGEAFHGDLGMIQAADVALMISSSGETEELIRLLPFLKHQGNPIVALTGKLGSTLAKHADVVLDISVEREACNNNLAPTSSTTATVVMGDALAVTLSTLRGFQPEDFARFHPGGSLGRRLLTRVADVMRADNLPVCQPQSAFRDVIHTISQGRLGLALVERDNALVGIITDGDIRRTFERHANPLALLAHEIMTSTPKTIRPTARLADAEEVMRNAKIGAVVVSDDGVKVLGILQIYNLDAPA